MKAHRACHVKTVDLKLPSGLCIRDAVATLQAKFVEWPWEKYDGDPPCDPDMIVAADIDRANRLARADRKVYEPLMDKCGPTIRDLLARLPKAPLEEADFDAARAAIVELFDLFLGMKHVGLARATKLLYPFRPSFLAVMDSLLENYYWWATSIRDEARFRQLERAFRDSKGQYVFELLSLLRDDIRGAKDDIDSVIRGCSGLPYATVPRIRVVESLIWYYYARGRIVPEKGTVL